MLGRNVFWLIVYSWFIEIQLKALKDDILSDLGPAFVITLVIVIHALCTLKWTPAPARSLQS
jgi:hypothetical protein